MLSVIEPDADGVAMVMAGQVVAHPALLNETVVPAEGVIAVSS